MTGRGDDDVPDPELEHALATVARPMARPAFREELRRRFCSEVPVVEGLERAGRAGGDVQILPFPDPSVARRRTFLRFGGLLAAAAILAVGFIVLESPAPRWKLLHVPEGTVVKVDGKVAPVDDTVKLARTLSGGKEIEVERGGLVLQIEDLVLFEAAEGTHVAFEGFDRRAAGAPYAVRVSSGRLRAVTGPAFRGHTMKVSADLVDATVAGTAFAVDYESHGTCVCCVEGVVQVSGEKIGPDPKPVAADTMCLVYRTVPEPPKWAPAPFWHADPLRKLAERAREIWP